MKTLTKKIINAIYAKTYEGASDSFRDPESFLDNISCGMIAAMSGDLSVLKKYFNEKDKIRACTWKTEPRYNLVCFSAGVTEGVNGAWNGFYRKSPEVIKYLKSLGCDFSGKKSGSESPLCEPIAQVDLELVGLLLKLGTDPKPVKGKFSPLAMACQTGSLELVRILLDHKCGVLGGSPNDKDVIIVAATEGGCEIVDLLLEHGANPNAIDMWGSTPLMLAAARGDSEMVRLLLRKGSDLSIIDNRRKRAIDYVDKKNKALVKLLS